MNNYPNNIYPIKKLEPIPMNGDRQFLFPFLVGAVTGGAAVGLTRPRPIYNVAPTNSGGGYNQGPMPPYYRPGGPYSYYSYGGYVPGPYGY